MSKLIKTHAASAKLGGGKLHQYSCGTMSTNNTLCGKAISIDNSGVGHNWRTVDASGLNDDVREILAGEIIDGGRESGKECIGGIWYRWA